MEFFSAIKKRSSVREYQDKKIDRNIIAKAIEAGAFAATARNVQPWEFIVIYDKKNIDLIAKECPNGLFMKDADCVISVFSKETKYYLEDCSAATQNILLAIQALGLGACWIAGDKKPYMAYVKNLLKVPDGYRLVSMISVGYPKGKVVQKSKRNLEEMIHWETW